MQPLNMIEMKVTQEDKGGFIIFYKFINLMKAIACIEDNDVLLCFDKNTNCITCFSIIPPICPEKCYFHLSEQYHPNPYLKKYEKS